MELIHNTCHHSLHYGNRAGQCRKQNHGKKQGADEIPHLSHRRKYFGKRHEHQTRSRSFHSFRSHKSKHCWYDHHTCQESYHCIEYLDLINGLNKVGIILYIRTIGHHDSHGHAETEKQLSHGIHQHREKSFDGKIFKIWNNIYKKSLHSSTGGSIFPSTLDRQGKYRNKHNKQKQKGHDHFGKGFNSLIHPSENHNCYQQQKQNHKNDWLCCTGDIPSKISILCCYNPIACHKSKKILEHPAADHTVIGHNDNRNKARRNSQWLPFLTQLPISGKRTLFGLSANSDLRRQQCKSKGYCQNQINHQKQSAAILRCQVRKPPYIP